MFAHAIDDPLSIFRLTEQSTPAAKADRLKSKSATMVLLGIGSELRSDRKRIEELAAKRMNMETTERYRSIAHRLRMNGHLETATDARSFREAIIHCAEVHITITSLARGLVPSPFCLDRTAKVSPILPPPLEDDEELREVKVMILGHQATGKTTLLKRLEEEEQSKQSKFTKLLKKIEEMRQPKSTIGIKFKSFSNFAKPVLMHVLDFAGQTEYSTIHEHFLSPFNSVYIVVVNAAADDRRRQVRHWMHLLQTHAKGPRAGSCGLLVVGTMIDLITGEGILASRERDIAEEVRSWGITKQLARFQVIMASNKTGDGLDRVWRSLSEMAQAIGALKVPHSFKLAQADIVQKASESRKVFLDMQGVRNLVAHDDAKQDINTHEAWDDLLQHLHDVGQAVFEPASSVVCLDVEVLGKLMSAFVAPEHHIGRLFQEKARYKRSDIVSPGEAVARMMGVKQVKLGEGEEDRKKQCEWALSFLIQCRLCYELTAEEAAEMNNRQRGLMFPALRVPCDVFSVPFSRTPGDRLAAARLRSTGRDISLSMFSRVVVGLRHLLNPKFRVFSNCAILRDEARGNQILVAMRPGTSSAPRKGSDPSQAAPSASAPRAREDDEENEVIVVSQGRKPGTWRESLVELVEMCDLVDPLCPTCVQRNLFVVLAIHPPAAELSCEVGHTVKPVDVTEGAVLDHTITRNSLWAPIHSDAFLKSSPEKWTTEGCVHSTILTEQETDEVRRAEYLRARSAFYQFVGADREQSIVLTKVEFIQNDDLEANFARFFDKLVDRMLSRGRSATLPEFLATESTDKQEWRAWVLRQLDRSVMRVSGNEGINLILGWHGASEESIRKIVKTGFLEQSELAAAGITVTDPGYFGPGIYFTQFPSYGARYAARRKSKCLLVSWVLMGNTYPVIESPQGMKMALTAKVEPFDSHFVVVDQLYNFPCKPLDPPGLDEIVVFSKHQILPRIIFHFSDAKKSHEPSLACSKKPQEPSSAAPPGSPSQSFEALPEELKNAKPLVLWVDRDMQSIDSHFKVFQIHLPKIHVVKCGSSSEANVWLGRYNRSSLGRLVVITNRSREQDGGDLAWEKTIETVRSKGLSKVRVIVFCRDMARVKEKAATWKRVTVTNSAEEVIKWLKDV